MNSTKLQTSQITGVVPSRMKLPKPYAQKFHEKLRQREINRANNQLLGSLMSAEPRIDNKLNGYTARVVQSSHQAQRKKVPLVPENEAGEAREAREEKQPLVSVGFHAFKSEQRRLLRVDEDNQRLYEKLRNQ